MNTEATLSSVYEFHKAEIARLKVDYTRELNAKLEQINKQAETIKEERRRLDVADRDRCRMSERICGLDKQLLSALAAIESTLSSWRKELAYLDSIQLTEAGDSSRYQLNKCIQALEKVDALAKEFRSQKFITLGPA